MHCTILPQPISLRKKAFPAYILPQPISFWKKAFPALTSSFWFFFSIQPSSFSYFYQFMLSCSQISAWVLIGWAAQSPPLRGIPLGGISSPSIHHSLPSLLAIFLFFFLMCLVLFCRFGGAEARRGQHESIGHLTPFIAYYGIFLPLLLGSVCVCYV